jgi:hypothetical protein
MQDQNSSPCKNGHVVEGVAPQTYDEKFKDKVCDCRRVMFVWELCGCPGKKEYKIAMKANPNY